MLKPLLQSPTTSPRGLRTRRSGHRIGHNFGTTAIRTVAALLMVLARPAGRLRAMRFGAEEPATSFNQPQRSQCSVLVPFAAEPSSSLPERNQTSVKALFARPLIWTSWPNGSVMWRLYSPPSRRFGDAHRFQLISHAVAFEIGNRVADVIDQRRGWVVAPRRSPVVHSSPWCGR